MARLVAPLTDQEIPATLARDDEVTGLLADKEPLGAYRPGGTDVAVADGGTGASSASAARTNLGLGNVDDISAMDMPVSTAQGAALDLKANADEAASVEELFIVTIVPKEITVTESFPLFIARFPLEVVSCSLCSWANTIVASANYWRFNLRRTQPNGTGVTNTNYAAKQTSSTTMLAGHDFNFDSETFDPASRQFAKGDVGAIVPTAIGSPTSIQKLIVVLGYRPL